jgi:hypothetical protein
MAAYISWGIWASFSSGASSIPKSEKRKSFSSITTCASTWRTHTRNLRKNLSYKERKMTKKSLPTMIGSSLTRITERPGKLMYIVQIRSDTLPLRRPPKVSSNLSLVLKKI